MMHGQGQDAETWLTGYFVGTPLPLKLVDQGYIVYMGNNRGTKFSDNTLVKSKASEAYWNFDFTDMGESDLPAFLHTIKEFDTVNHNILLHKLYNYGIRGVAHKWCTDYLNGRSQFVQ